MKTSRFVHGVKKDPSEWSQPGKPEWPNFLDIEMDRYRALKCLEELSRQLQDSSCEVVSLMFAGKLTDVDE